MGSIILLALAAAVYPQLLAVVVIILTRPNPQPLLWACYLASLLVSVGSSVVIFAVFHSRGSVAGTSSHRLGPAAYLSVGAIAVLVAILMGTRHGRKLFGRDRPATRGPERRPRPGSATAAKTRARAERALSEGSVVVACLVGALLAIPGPFDLVAAWAPRQRRLWLGHRGWRGGRLRADQIHPDRGTDRGLHDRPRRHRGHGQPLLALDADQQARGRRSDRRSNRDRADRQRDLGTRLSGEHHGRARGFA